MSVFREPWQMTQEEFIGPYMISETFAFDGRGEDYDHFWANARQDDLEVVWTSDCGRYQVKDLEWDRTCVFLYAVDAIKDDVFHPIGFYFDGMAWIDADYRGQGLATDLILAAAKVAGGSPTNNEEGMGFSEAGLKAHEIAHWRSVERAVEQGFDVPQEVLDEYGLDGAMVNNERTL